MIYLLLYADRDLFGGAGFAACENRSGQDCRECSKYFHHSLKLYTRSHSAYKWQLLAFCAVPCFLIAGCPVTSKLIVHCGAENMEHRILFRGQYRLLQESVVCCLLSRQWGKQTSLRTWMPPFVFSTAAASQLARARRMDVLAGTGMRPRVLSRCVSNYVR